MKIIKGHNFFKKQFLVFVLLAILTILTLREYINNDREMVKCIFCDIVAGSTQTKIEKETDDYVIFKDIKPASTYHYLAVPKRHVESLKALTKDDIKKVNALEKGIKDLMNEKGINTTDALFGFHMPPFISVKHLHLHGIAPQSDMNWLSRFIYKPYTHWFKTVDDAKEYLKTKS